MLCCLLWGSLARAAGQGLPPTAPWQADSVLSALPVRALANDSAGYLWVATADGLLRYDGYQTVPLTQLLASPQASPPRGYLNALVRVGGSLWFGGAAGLYCLVPATGALRRVPLPIGPRDGTVVVYALWLDVRTQRLWVGYCSGRVLALDLRHPLARQPLPPELAEQPSAFAAAPEGGVWLTTKNGEVHHLNARGQRVQRLQQPGEYLLPVPGTQPQQFVSSHARYAQNPRTGQLREQQRWLPRPQGGSQPFHPSYDELGRPTQWLVQQQRLVVQWAGPDTLPHCTTKRTPVAFDAHEPSTDYTLFQDQRRLWWAFSAEGRGCYKGGTAVPVRAVPIAGVARPPSVRGLAQLPDGRLLVSSYNGVFVQAAGHPAAPLQPLALTEQGRPWPALLHHLLVTKAGRVLFADESNTFGELDPRTGALTYYPLRPRVDAAQQLRTRTLLQARTGTVWGGATSGLYQLDEATRQVTRYRHYDAAWPLHGREVRGISEDAAGTLWLATDRGLYALVPATGVLRHFGTHEPAPRRLPDDDVLSVCATAGRGVWVGTRAHGLLWVEARRGLRRQVSTRQGLPSPVVATVVAGAAGELWAGTFAGLARYRPATGQLAVYGPAEGLLNPELNRQAALRAPGGTLYFGGLGGVFRVEAGAAPAGPDRPPGLLLTAQATPQRLRPLLTAPVLAPLALANSTTEAGFNLALNDFRASHLNRFFYQLQEADATQPAAVQQTGPRLRLQGLAPGTYTLAVWGQTPAGQRTPRQHLRVVVARPWWQHPLLLLGAGGLLVGAGIGLQKLRSQRALQEAQLRTRIAADLHDEVGALLTRVNLRAELLQEPAAPAEQSADMQALLLDSRAALLMMRDVVWSIDAGADTVGALRDRLHDHLEATAHAAGLHATLAVRNLPDATPLPPQLRQHLYLIAKEAVTNTVRHAPAATRLELTLRRQGATLELLVHNDGGPVDFLPQPSSGMGLRNMQRRAQTLGGQCTSGPVPNGWCVCVQVPYKG